jgi:hypothetical protein
MDKHTRKRKEERYHKRTAYTHACPCTYIQTCTQTDTDTLDTYSGTGSAYCGHLLAWLEGGVQMAKHQREAITIAHAKVAEANSTLCGPLSRRFGLRDLLRGLLLKFQVLNDAFHSIHI